MEGIIAKRYARALMLLAQKVNKVEPIGAQIAELSEVYHQDKNFREFIAEPKYRKSAKLKTVGDILKKMGVDEQLRRFCGYLLVKNRFELIEWISRSYQGLANSALNKAVASITLPFDIDEKETQKIQKQLADYSGKKIELSVLVDPEIIGGAITTIGSVVLDGSIKNRLNLIHETISRGN
ncbi:MAG: ATP synthase F1 subunit delta [Deltaproteobacteria bacterium]|nr:ATP synthase F1 subunit delta [Deltaproteobacteria bacterium]